VLRSGEVDAVVLATPASTHARLGLAVLDAGCHLFVEKPLALDTVTAQEVVAEAARRGLVMMVGHTFLYSPAVIRLGELMRGGSLGEVRYIHAQRLLGQVRLDCNVLWDLGAHDVSIIMHLLGERPVEVVGRGYCHMGTGTEDAVLATMLFESGVDASIHVGWVNPFKVRLLTAVGTQRMAVYDDVALDPKVRIFDAGLDQADPIRASDDESSFSQMGRRVRAGDIYTPSLSSVEPLRQEMEDFGQACAIGHAPVSNAALGLDVVRVLEAIDTSMAEGSAPIAVDWSELSPQMSLS
ncbi:MAG TPA: Gfo/Idh/MocA family oxidoreductase, partial [Acidimicrobiales bacterium]|nr:Gfo/Idh/MocA family oxidoreductase [Acidimicrobiales bacterium]